MPITTTPKIWMNGKLVDWDKAQVHVLTHTLHYGTGVFEGIRAYETDKGPAVFRLTEHMQRLINSAKILGMPMPYSLAELVQGVKDTVASTGLPSSTSITPLPFRSSVGSASRSQLSGRSLRLASVAGWKA